MNDAENLARLLGHVEPAVFRHLKGAMNTAATTAEEIAKRLEAVRQGTQEAVGRGIEAVHTALERLKTRIGEVEQAVGKANQTVNDATAKMAEAYKGLTSIVEANLLRQIEAVKARYQQEQSALETTKQSEAALTGARSMGSSAARRSPATSARPWSASSRTGDKPWRNRCCGARTWSAT